MTGEGGAPSAPPSVRFFLPAAPLRELITSYYLIEATAPLADNLHPEWANIRFSLAGRWLADSFTGLAETPFRSALFGPTDRTRRFSSEGGTTLGVGLTPLGWVRLIGGDASKLANAFTELGDLLGTPGDTIAARLQACADDGARCALLDDLFVARLRPATADEALVAKAQRVLIGGEAETIADLAHAMGLQYRTLSRFCRRVFGFGPKRLFRRQRFLRTLAQVRDRLDQPLTSVLDPAYYDQAHFSREFRAYMGTTPTAYFSSPREVMRRAAAERMRVVGAPVQGLHGYRP